MSEHDHDNSTTTAEDAPRKARRLQVDDLETDGAEVKGGNDERCGTSLSESRDGTTSGESTIPD